MKRFWFLLCLGLVSVSLFLVSGCGNPPTQKIQAAQAALDSAKTMGADQYVQVEYQAAMTYLDSANAYVQSKDYKKAAAFADSATEKAHAAIAAVPGAKEQMKADLTSGLTKAGSALDAVKKSLQQAAKKVKKASLAPLQTELTNLEKLHAQAMDQAKADQILEAKNSLDQLTLGTQRLQADLNALTAPKPAAAKPAAKTAKKAPKPK